MRAGPSRAHARRPRRARRRRRVYPTTAKLEDRARLAETREAESLHDLITTARTIMVDELQQRFFSERPSNLRLVQVST
jgi:hypothetical protein